MEWERDDEEEEEDKNVEKWDDSSFKISFESRLNYRQISLKQSHVLIINDYFPCTKIISSLIVWLFSTCECAL